MRVIEMVGKTLIGLDKEYGNPDIFYLNFGDGNILTVKGDYIYESLMTPEEIDIITPKTKVRLNLITEEELIEEQEKQHDIFKKAEEEKKAKDRAVFLEDLRQRIPDYGITKEELGL